MQTTSYEFLEKSNSIITDQSPFYICENSSEISVLFRVLSGSCIIINKNNETPVEINRNYFFSDFRNNSDSDVSFLNDFEEGINLSDYESFIKKTAFKHRKFYKYFLSEITGAIYNEELEKHTASFVHLYRAYEYLSYSFPMIYASKTDNFMGTFENLRKWMTNSDSDGNKGELKFYKSYVSTLFKGLPELSTTIDINITAKEEFKEYIFLSLTKKALEWNSEEKFTPLTIKPNKISINFLDFHSFIINLRNRYFHYSNSRSDNISTDDIIDSDLLFSIVNKCGINYITRIFHETVKHQI
jgi:hypothetical protein